MATATAAKPAEFFTDLLRAHVLDKVHSNLNSAQEEWSELLKRQGSRPLTVSDWAKQVERVRGRRAPKILN